MHDVCSLCSHSGENAVHVLISCPIAKVYWRRILTSVELSTKLHSISGIVLLVKSLKKSVEVRPAGSKR